MEENNLSEIKELKEMFDVLKDTLTNRRRYNIDNSTLVSLFKDAYETLKTIYDLSDEEGKRWAVKQDIMHIIPICDEAMEYVVLDDLQKQTLYLIYKDLFAFAGRRSFHHFLLHVEMAKPPKDRVYENRMEVLRSVVYYLNKMTFEEQFTFLSASYPPSFGKSFIGNYYTAWIFGVCIDHSVLRLSYSDTLVKGFSRAIKDLMGQPEYKEIFPYYETLGKNMFEPDQVSEWKIVGSGQNVITSHYAITRDGSITGVRANYMIMLDDMTKGVEEAYNDDAHAKMFSKYMTEWRNRKSNLDTVKEIFLGTMWSPKDILARSQIIAKSRGRVRRSKRFKYVEEVVDSKKNVIAVIIRMPLLDENGKSTCENVYSTKMANELKRDTDEFEFSCVYQQNPIAPKGRAFATENTNNYTMNKGKYLFNGEEVELNDIAKAVIDPVRKGSDNISMPILKQWNNDPEQYVLVDAIYGGKSMDSVYDEIIAKVKVHKISKLVLENNTDTSLKALLDGKFEENGINYCEITEKFNTKPKFMRIKDEEFIIRNQVWLPSDGIFPPNSQVFKFMESLRTYSYEQQNKYDDAPDSLALFSNMIIRENETKAKVEVLNRSEYWF